MSELSRGLVFGVTAYLLWGLFPLYIPLLNPSGSLEILAHRVVWSLVFLLLILAVRWHWRWIAPVLRNPRRLVLVAVAATAITANWGMFIYAVHIGQTLQASLGYFINPLVSVALGVVVLGESLRRAQLGAVGLGAIAVLVLSLGYGSVPWLSLGMAGSFAAYGLLKKFIGLDGQEGLSMETTMLLLPALGYLTWLQLTGVGTFAMVSTGHTLLLMAAGIVTALPLALFGSAAFRLPLSYVGLLQFITPVMQFLIAWLVFAEELPPSRWVGFAIVWCALAVFVVDLLRNRPRRSKTGGRGRSGDLPSKRIARGYAPADSSSARGAVGLAPAAALTPELTSELTSDDSTSTPSEESRGAGTSGSSP